MATGYEDEFRQLFAQEAEQRLSDMSTQLMALEEAGADPELVASIFRDAHTLKGAAGVVGLDEITAVAHAMEDLLEPLRAGERLATPDLIDALLGAVDGVRDMLGPVLAGESRASDAVALVRMLESAATPAGGVESGSDSDDASEASTESEAATGGIEAEPRPDLPDRPESIEPDLPPQVEPGAAPEVVAPARSATRQAADAEAVRVPLARLDELVRLVGESASANLRVGRLLHDRFGVDPSTIDEVRELSRVLNELQERTMRARMVPVSTITDTLQRAVRDVSRATGKDVRWEVRGEDTELDRGVLQQLSDPLLHLVRNAVDHGIESPEERAAVGKSEQAVVRLHAMQLGSEVIITITDDGAGIDVDRVRAEASSRGVDASDLSDDEALYLIFRSGLSTADFVSDISGRGVGLDVVRANVEAVRGRVEIVTEPGVGTEFRVVVPITLAVLPCLLVGAGGARHAIPMHSVVLAQEQGAETTAEGKPVVWVGGQAVALSDLGAVLGLPPVESGPIVLVAGLTRRHAFRVEALLGQRDVVVKGLSRLLPRLDVLAGASVEPDGSILLVLDVPGVIDRARLRGAPAGRADAATTTVSSATRAKLLVVDDALTVRELQRSILQRGGYEVRTAVDGVEAMAALAEEPFDLVLTDIEMPRMDGFALTEAIRAHPARANVPVLILTSRATEADRQRGMQAGADGYIIKSAFDESALLSAVERLLGRR